MLNVTSRAFRLITLAIGAAAVTGCNSYSEHFVSALDTPHPEPVFYSAYNIRPSPAPPVLIETDDIDEDLIRKQAEGYAVLGRSTFVGQPASRDKALEHGQEIGAELVLLQRVYLNTFERLRSDTRHETIHEEYDEVVYKDGKRERHKGESRTSVPVVTEEEELVSYYDQRAVYLARWLNPLPLGAGVRDLTRQQMIDLGVNHGVEVLYVTAGTPAAEAGMVPGDVILDLNGTDVSSPSAYRLLTQDFRGQMVRIDLLRRGQPMTMNVQFR